MPERLLEDARRDSGMPRAQRQETDERIHGML
jgi:hypothetical protein